MNRHAVVPVLLLAALGAASLAACTASGTAAITPGASAKPQAGSSAKPSPGASAGASTAPAATGQSTVALTIGGKAVTLAGDVKWSPTDLVGKRLRLGASIGDDANPQKGHGTVSFLFGGGGVHMLPGWDVKASGAVAGVTIFWVDPDANAGRTYYLDFKTVEGATLAAADGRIKGGYEGTAKAQSGSAATPAVESAIKLTFDLVQPPM